MPVIYIKENKSVEEYLCQLAEMGEQRTDYESIWQYTDGRTEERFPFYEYPSPLKGTTERYTHLA
jgi:lysine 2,3-aminomutase